MPLSACGLAWWWRRGLLGACAPHRTHDTIDRVHAWAATSIHDASIHHGAIMLQRALKAPCTAAPPTRHAAATCNRVRVHPYILPPPPACLPQRLSCSRRCRRLTARCGRAWAARTCCPRIRRSRPSRTSSWVRACVHACMHVSPPHMGMSTHGACGIALRGQMAVAGAAVPFGGRRACPQPCHHQHAASLALWQCQCQCH